MSAPARRPPAELLVRRLPERRAVVLVAGAALLVEDLRAQVVEVLRELREVAGSLRPVALDQLGLRPALEALAIGGRLALELDDAPATLDPAAETALYRIVQEAVAGTTDRVPVRLAGTPADVTLDLRLPGGTAVLPAIQARAEVTGGRVEATGTRVRVALPR
jgi:signal transduction histidine kinase